MEITFGKFKGSTVEQLAKTEDGSKWLAWYVEKGLDVNDPKWGKKNQERKDEVLRIWKGAKEAKPSSPPVVGSVVPAGDGRVLHQMSLKIDVMDKKLTELLRNTEAIQTLMAGGNDTPKSPDDIAWEE
jgi:hypothetical protein